MYTTDYNGLTLVWDIPIATAIYSVKEAAGLACFTIAVNKNFILLARNDRVLAVRDRLQPTQLVKEFSRNICLFANI
jgi:hypothetical protein